MATDNAPPTSPLFSTLEKVDTWLSVLPRDDLTAAREQIAKALQRLTESRTFLTVDGVNALVRFDEGCLPTLNDILRRYLDKGGTGNTEQVRADMEAIQGLLGRAYCDFVVTYHQTRSSAKQVAQLMALAICRGIHALTNQAKWGYFARETPPADCWRQIHLLYRWAEQDEVDTRPVTLYPRPHEIVTSCGGLYSRASLLSTLNSGAFSATQIETADHWLLTWTAKLTLQRMFMAGEHFHASLINSSQPPMRVRAALDDDNARYIRTQSLALEIERARARLQDGAAQRDMGFIAVQPLAESALLLDRLAELWVPDSLRADQRKERRIKVDSEAINVVRGLNGVCESARQDYERAHGPLDLNRGLSREEEMDLQVYGFITERTRSKLRLRPLDATQPIPALEGWTLIDESLTGYGAAFPAGTYRDPKLGTFVGIKRRKTERWAVGTIVRVRTNRTTRETYAGIEILSFSPVIVTLGEDAPDAALKTSQLVWGLFLTGDKSRGETDTLLIDNFTYSSSRAMVMGARNVRYAIRLGKSVRKGEGWQRVTFEVAGKRS